MIESPIDDNNKKLACIILFHHIGILGVRETFRLVTGRPTARTKNSWAGNSWCDKGGLFGHKMGCVTLENLSASALSSLLLPLYIIPSLAVLQWTTLLFSDALRICLPG